MTAALARLRTGWPTRRRALPQDALLLVAATLLGVLALVLPPVSLPLARTEAVVVFDITQSMDVEDAQLDGQPVSRIVFARAAAQRALADLPCGSRIGWAAFTEYRTLLLLAPIEVCANYDDLLSTLAEIDGRIRWGNASEVAKGVFWALRASKEVASHPAIVFLTDGQEAPPLTSFPRFDDVQPGQVQGWLVGVGGSVPRPIPRTDAQGQRIGYWRPGEVMQRPAGDGPGRSHEHLSELREPHLRTLAAQTGLGYAALREPAGLGALLREPQLAHRTPVPTALHAVPAALALLLLGLSFAPTWRRRRSPPPAAVPCAG